MSSTSALDVAPDGSPVEVYRRLPAGGEPELIDAAISAGSDVLDLGAGTGRLTHGLLALSHRVTAVDQSAEMLRHVRGAETVVADLETLELGRRFDAVILVSHFVNDADARRRRAFLSTCARHVAQHGVVVIQAYDPDLDWEAARGRERRIGDVAVRIVAATTDGRRVDAAVEYEVDGATWRQEFAAEMLDENDLRRELEAVGLRFDRWLDRSQGWLLARLI